jgi:hypothetical protein
MPSYVQGQEIIPFSDWSYMNAFSSLRRPSLSGDNWWRGHAAAFLKYTNLPPEALRRGRVCQVKFIFLS